MATGLTRPLTLINITQLAPTAPLSNNPYCPRRTCNAAQFRILVELPGAHTDISMTQALRAGPTLVPAISAPAIGKLTAWQEAIAKRLMLDHLDAGISVAEVAEACAMSRSHFTRKFKESTCLSPHVWLRQQRVEKARELLLQSSLSLTDIAMECGFFDQAHFCRVFAKGIGMSPMVWKRQQALASAIQMQRIAC